MEQAVVVDQAVVVARDDAHCRAVVVVRPRQVGSVLIPEGLRLEGSFGVERFLKIWKGRKDWVPAAR